MSRAILFWPSQVLTRGAGRAWAWPGPGVGAFLSQAFLSPVQLPRWQTHLCPQSTAPQIRPSCHAPARCIHSDPTCPVSRLSVVSLHLSSICSPFLFICTQQPRLLPCILTFVLLCICRCQSHGSDCPILFFADPSLRACSRTASSTKPV